jgi:drug/metabolite transporter (DMT)-like permease
MAVAGAALVLGEDLGALRVAGVAAIVGGLWLLSRRRAEPTAPDVDPIAADEPPSPVRRRLRPALAIPVLTGLAYAGADLFRSSALDEQVEPLVGAFIGLLVAVGGWSAAITALPPLRTRLRVGRSAPWFAASGAMASCAIMMQFHALADGDVSVVSPIVACQPLVVLLLARLVLSDIEQLRRTTIAGGIATVTGAVLVSI